MIFIDNQQTVQGLLWSTYLSIATRNKNKKEYGGNGEFKHSNLLS